VSDAQHGLPHSADEQLKATECLQVLGADTERVFVAEQPGASTMQAYQKAQQLIQP
jgi:hypothetical protein